MKQSLFAAVVLSAILNNVALAQMVDPVPPHNPAPTPAPTSCTELAKHKLSGPTSAAGFTALLGAPAVMINPLFFLTIPVAGAGYLIATGKPRSVIKLLQQAEYCQGKKISKLYSNYRSQTQQPATFAEFCKIIQKGNQDRSFCPLYLPSQDEILDFVSAND